MKTDPTSKLYKFLIGPIRRGKHLKLLVAFNLAILAWALFALLVRVLGHLAGPARLIWAIVLAATVCLTTIFAARLFIVSIRKEK